MDRVAPTRRPAGRPQGWQSWRELAFLHWPVPAEILRPTLPPGLELDTYDGVAWVGVVPFLMEGVRPWRIWPKFLAFRFPELNLRTYVHRGGADPGVWFYSLDAASWLAVQAARIGWSLPYFHATLGLQREGDRVTYTSRRRRGRAHLDLTYRIGDALPPSDPASLEFFLFERYLLYSWHRGRLYRGQVHHPPYGVHGVEVERLDQSLLSAAGLPGENPPVLAHFSPGVDVEIFPLRPEK
ncbi:MAG: DUF2071 domain-containing protein [bacterium]